MVNKPINHIERADVDWFAHRMTNPDGSPTNGLDHYQRIATKSAIYPGKGTPFGLMYVALGLAEAGEVQNKVKKAFRDDRLAHVAPFIEALIFCSGSADFGEGGQAREGWLKLCAPLIDEFAEMSAELTPERRKQIIKELGGALWYIAAVCNEIGANMSEVALTNLEELCDRGERGVLSGDGDER